MSTVNEILNQFSDELNDSFTDREKKQISKMFVMNRFKLDAIDLILKKNDKIEDHAIKNIFRDVKKINKGNPVQYVLGSTHFYGLDLKTDHRALIPRPETEELISWILESTTDESPKILDVGTGSGCIALALKANLPKCDARGVDVHTETLELAQENADNLGLQVRFDIGNALQLDAYSKYKWDIIVSNPPYIPFSDKSTMQSHVVKYEPEAALFVSNDDPLIFYKSIAQYAKAYLVPNGKLFFEINESFAEEVKEILNLLGFSNIEVKKDLQGKDRMVRANL